VNTLLLLEGVEKSPKIVEINQISNVTLEFIGVDVICGSLRFFFCAGDFTISTLFIHFKICRWYGFSVLVKLTSRCRKVYQSVILNDLICRFV
jgi:hypothetical protein